MVFLLILVTSHGTGFWPIMVTITSSVHHQRGFGILLVLMQVLLLNGLIFAIYSMIVEEKKQTNSYGMHFSWIKSMVTAQMSCYDILSKKNG
jgi:competence protein ComGC